VLFDGRESFITAEASGFGELFSYSLVDGAAGWKYPLNEAAEMPILKKGGSDPAGTVFAVNRAGKLSALRADDGKLLWSLPLAPVSCAPIWADSALWLADFEGKLNAVKDGKEKTVRLPSAALALEAGNRMLFAACADSSLEALTTLDGKTLWKLETGGKVRSLAFADWVLYYTTTSGGVSSCRVADGEKLWEKKLEVLVSAPLLALPSVVLVGSAEGRLFALSAQSGEILWERKLPGGLFGRPVREGDKVYITSGKKVLAFQF
jgi:outer membrane protein assembly factor BamB